MEFGPRALGARSILGDPRSPRMQAQMNIKIKFREGFRPFAPSVLRERVADYFELDGDSPYMLLVAPVREGAAHSADRGATPALGHRQAECAALGHSGGHARRLLGARPDGHARRRNRRYYDLIKAFERRTGCAVLSTRRSTCAASRSSARRRTPTGASCARTSTSWCSGRSAREGGSSRTWKETKHGSRNSSSTDGAAGTPVRR